MATGRLHRCPNGFDRLYGLSGVRLSCASHCNGGFDRYVHYTASAPVIHDAVVRSGGPIRRVSALFPHKAAVIADPCILSGVAVGLAGTFRLFGGAAATAIYTAIYSTRFTEALPGEMKEAISQSGVPFSDGLLAGLVKAGQLGTKAAYEAVAGATPKLVELAQEATKQSYVKGFSLVYLVAIAFGVVATVASACTVSTDRSKKNNARAVVMMNERKETNELSKAV